jgi:ferritin
LKKIKLFKMKISRLSKKRTIALNGQMTKEAHAAQIYLSYAAWAENKG